VPDADLDLAFTEGRVTRRAFVRQLVDDGMTLPDALARADALVPQAPAAPSSGSPADRATPDRAPVVVPDRPRRRDGLVVEFVGDGYLVYDPERERMHSLNHSASLVLELCTGENDVAEIARLVGAAYSTPTSPDTEVRACLESLVAESLVG
jgi:hypothetical protein